VRTGQSEVENLPHWNVDQRNNIALTTFYWKASILVASTNDRGLPGTNTRARAEEFGSKPPTLLSLA
jgi:hypothetical protein